jgi:hypothetical protein
VRRRVRWVNVGHVSRIRRRGPALVARRIARPPTRTGPGHRPTVLCESSRTIGRPSTPRACIRTTCATLADLSRFPFTDKHTLRSNYPFGMFAVPREERRAHPRQQRHDRQPTVVGYTIDDIDRWADLMARCLYVGGVRKGDVFHNISGYGLFTGGLGVHYGAERLGCSVVPISGGMTERQVQLIRDFAPRGALHAELLRRRARPHGARRHRPARHVDQGRDVRRRAVDAMPCATAIEARAGLKAQDLFGLSELIGPGVASESIEARDGLIRVGGPLLSRDRRPRDPRTGAGRPDRRARAHQPHQAGLPRRALSHQGPHLALPGTIYPRRCATWPRSPAAPTT